MEKMKPPSQKVLQRRKFLMVLPLIVIPFLTLFFWAMGGGKGPGVLAQETRTMEGLKMDLPVPKIRGDSNWNKMKFYQQADEEAAKRETQIRNDPYYNLPLTETEPVDTFDVTLPVDTRGKRPLHGLSAPKSPFASTDFKDPNEATVYRKLAELDKELNRQTVIPVVPFKNKSTSSLRSGKSLPNNGGRLLRNDDDDVTDDEDESPEIKQLQDMMKSMDATASEPDPEMQEINKVLDKLMDVQHPERLQDKLKEASVKAKGTVFPVSASGYVTPISVLENSRVGHQLNDSTRTVVVASNGFYSLEDNIPNQESVNAITAVIHEKQTLVAGATVKLRLTTDIFIQGILIPKDQFVYGTATLNGERLMITVSSIRYQNGLYPVELSVYDLDGMAGIYIPGAITRDVAKQSADQSLQGLGLSSLDPSIGMQAASAGIEVTKNLLSKRVKLVKVMVKAGYQVLLKDNNHK